MERLRKRNEEFHSMNWKSSLSSEMFNYMLLIVRYEYSFANIYPWNNSFLRYSSTLISFIHFFHLIFLYGTFEIFFKEISYLSSSNNLYLYLLIFTLIFSNLVSYLRTGFYHYFILLIFSERISSIADDQVNLFSFDQCLFFHISFLFLVDGIE